MAVSSLSSSSGNHSGLVAFPWDLHQGPYMLHPDYQTYDCLASLAFGLWRQFDALAPA